MTTGPPDVPERLGPCRLHHRLGSGAAGWVHLATLEEETSYSPAGAKVAVKILDPKHLSNGNVMERFRREASLGLSVRHPAVVRTLAVDRSEHRGTELHYLVMEYCEGRTLRELIFELGTLPEALLRDLARQIAAGLEAIHGAGATHRDLKPGNLLVTAEHQVKIMDFGVASLSETVTQLTKTGFFVGTPLYASPEQIRHEELGPPADLYSLGVILYEAATGLQPFDGGSPSATIRRQLNHVPQPAGDLNPQLTPWMEELVGRLLAKEPELRFATARELEEILEQGEASTWWQRRQEELALSPGEAQLRRLGVSQETPFVGRIRELRTVLTLYRDAAAGRGRAVLVEGEEGVGKSRFLYEIAAQLQSSGQDFLLLYGEAEPGWSEGSGALACSLVDHLQPTGLKESLRRCLAATPQLLPGLLRWLLDEPAAGEGAAALDDESLEAVVSYVACMLAGEKPLVWLVEDLHRASPQELGVFSALARTARENPILLVGSCRPSLDDGWRQILLEHRRAQHLPLKRLSRAQVSNLLKELLDTELAAATLGRKVSRKADGNPLFLVEMVRELRERQLERQEAGTSDLTHETAQVAIPAAVRSIVAKRLDRVRAEDRALLSLAALQGTVFDPDLVARASGRPRLEVLQALAALESKSGVVRSSGLRFTFDHPQLPEVLAGDLDERARRRGHQALGEAFLALKGEGRGEESAEAELEGDDAAFLAEHLLQGEEPDSALPYVLPALRFLGRHGRHEIFFELSRRALEVCPEEQEALRCDVLLSRVPMLRIRGRLRQSGAEAEAALALARGTREPARLARAKCALAVARGLAGEEQAATKLLDDADAQAVKAGDPKIQLELLLVRAGLLARGGRLREARATLKPLPSLEKAPEDEGAARGDALRAWLCIEEGREEEARILLERAIPALEKWERPPVRALAQLRLGRAHHRLGNGADARRELEGALAAARRAGAVGTALDALCGLGCLDFDDGRLDRAEHLLETVVQSARSRRLPRQEGRALRLLGEVARCRGRHDDAERLFTEALDRRYALSETLGIARAAFSLARHHLERRNSMAAEPLLEEAEALVSDHGLASPGPLPLIYLAYLGRRSAAEIEPRGGPLLERAEAHLLLYRLGFGDDRLSRCQELLEHGFRHLDDEDRKRFWRTNLVARAARRQLGRRGGA